MKRIFLFTAVAVSLFSTLTLASTTTPIINQQNFTLGTGDLETTFAMDPLFLRGDAHANQFGLAIGGNYFLTDMFAPGIELSYLHSGGDNFKFIPNMKAYWPVRPKLYGYFQAGLGYNHVGGGGASADMFDLRISPGIDYMLSNSVAIGFAFKYDLGVGSNTIHQIEFPLQFNIYFKL